MKKILPGKYRELWQPFTVVLPAHNEANYLPATLTQLRNTFEDLEYFGQIIVVNDDSNDSTPDAAREHDAIVVDVSLRNIGAVRNAGAKACQTPWLFFLDADTLLPPKTLSSALDLLAKGAAGGGAQVEIPSGTQITIMKWILFYLVKIGWQSIGGWAAGCFMFCRKEIFEEFGGFDEKYFAIEEYFFTKEVARRGYFALVRDPVVTSPRKLTAYSTFELLRFVTLPIMRPGRLFKTRLGLEVLYDDEKSR
jgi:glycosyltransferase involved in cell wall biosynthesis